MTSVILPSYIHNAETYRRHVRYIRFMDKHIKPRLGYSKMVLFDNASDMKYLKKLGATIMDENMLFLHPGRYDLFVIRFSEHLPRSGHLMYPYIWRFLYYIPKLHENMFFKSEKYYHIDSDNFILTNELIDYLKDIKEGFVSLYDSVHNFPESAMFTICNNNINLLTEEAKHGIFRNVEAENALPFTHIERKFYGGRLAEVNKPADNAHWVGQVERNYKVKFRG